jgi:hypothetical protein
MRARRVWRPSKALAKRESVVTFARTPLRNLPMAFVLDQGGTV